MVVLLAPALVAAQVKVRIEPEPVYIERTASGQLVSFDFELEYAGGAAASVSRIELFVYDRTNRLVLRKFMTTDGLKHGEWDVGSLTPNGRTFLLNPFERFERDADLHKLRYDFTFTGADDKETTSSVTLMPRPWVPRTALRLPLKGRVLVHDGHDFLAHHRRFGLAHPFLKELGINHNFTRFASDFCIVDERGELKRGASSDNTDWYGFGATVYAPGSGRVVRARGTVADNINGKATFTLEQFRADATTPAGNLVMIDHGNGEFSLMAHLKQGSVLVKEGDVVRAGQPVGQMGVSGDAYLPHVHYELRSAGEVNALGYPAYFRNFVRLLGSRRVPVVVGPVDSGDILLSR